MGGSQLAIKNRIRSIDSTMKITKAMQLVAASKYQRQKDRMRRNKEYATQLKDILDGILSTINDEHPLLVRREDTNPCTIIYTSDMGLCGSFNQNIYKVIESECTSEESIIMMGSRGAGWIKNRNYHVIDSYVQLEDDNYSLIASIAEMVLEKYISGEITSINVIYTEFKNPLTFVPHKVKILPVEESKNEKNSIDTLFEPTSEEILDDLIPMSVKSLLYSYYLETKTSEQASRRTSMENASDNAEELKETLSLQYNQARQASITQEITEIVAGSSAK